MLMGQMSSAYSLPRVKPAGRVMAAATMMSCQPQKWILESRSEAVRHLAEPLGGVVDAGEHHVADEGEDDRVGVQRAEAAEGGPGEFEVEEVPVELGGDENADEHADEAPDDGGEHEETRRAVVEFDGGGGSGGVCHFFGKLV